MNNSIKHIISNIVVPMIYIVAIFSVFGISSIVVIPYDKISKNRLYVKAQEMFKEFKYEATRTPKTTNRS